MFTDGRFTAIKSPILHNQSFNKHRYATFQQSELIFFFENFLHVHLSFHQNYSSIFDHEGKVSLDKGGWRKYAG